MLLLSFLMFGIYVHDMDDPKESRCLRFRDQKFQRLGGGDVLEINLGT